MNIIKSISEMQSLAESIRTKGGTIGFVPTMGFLHEGHLSLMRKAKQESATVVASIFVNPAQFGPGEDFEHYPRDSEGDTKKCESAGVDLLFMPSAADMYPEHSTVSITVDGISDILEGRVRPGHFRGVATVVAKLFHIVKPHTAYFGQKDFQQSVIIKRMVQGLHMDVLISVLPTVREQDGLAMSSRNTYLDAHDRQAAAVLYRALAAGRSLLISGERNSAAIRKEMTAVIMEEKGAVIDYVEIADPETLVPLATIAKAAVLLVAVRFGKTRLIDNLIIS